MQLQLAPRDVARTGRRPRKARGTRRGGWLAARGGLAHMHGRSTTYNQTTILLILVNETITQLLHAPRHAPMVRGGRPSHGEARTLSSRASANGRVLRAFL